jgi:hypothetical protein
MENKETFIETLWYNPDSVSIQVPKWYNIIPFSQVENSNAPEWAYLGKKTTLKNRKPLNVK